MQECVKEKKDGVRHIVRHYACKELNESWCSHLWEFECGKASVITAKKYACFCMYSSSVSSETALVMAG